MTSFTSVSFTSASLLALHLFAAPVSAQTPAPAPAAPVVVKPLELPPKIIELPQSTGRIIDDFINELGKHVEGLETSHGDVADCVETYRKTASEPRAITIPAYYEC